MSEISEQRKKDFFPIISFFNALADEEFNFENGKIKIFPQENLSLSTRSVNPEVSFVLPNEIVEIKCLRYKKENYYFFNKLISNPNKFRINAPCKHFENCGGCLYQNMNLEFYKNFKLNLLKKIFINEKFENQISKISEISVVGPNKRRKANFEAIKKNNQIFLGFHRFGSRQIIDIENCEIMNNDISFLINPLKLFAFNILNDFEKCEFFIIMAKNGIDIGFEIHGRKIITDESRVYIKEFGLNFNNITRIFFKSGKNSEIIYKKENEKDPYLLFNNYEININSYAFMQTSEDAENLIIESIKKFLPNNSKDLSLIDLFCGRGLYSFNFAQYFSKIYGFEIDDSAINDFAQSIKKYNFIDKILLFKQDLFSEPLFENFFNQNQFIIINPPRAGAKKICEQILNLKNNMILNYENHKNELRPGNIVYVSCNPKTFVKDASILIEAGYEITQIIPVDQFIWSNHIELIAHFKLL
jgi:23S rRNA (uracil1939-C5)-methyltransferase